MSPGDADKTAAPPPAGGAGATGGAARRWRPVAFAAAGSFLLHAVAVLWEWHSWRGFGRVGVLTWIDFPSSLAYLRSRGGATVAWSLLLGGTQWALIGAALSVILGRSARRPAK